MQKIPASRDVLKAQAIYTPLNLLFYDWVVLYFSNHYLWRCPTRYIQALYQEHISNNHLEAGVGTGYFLKHCRLGPHPRMALVDLNPHCLEATEKRIRDLHPEKFQKNLYEPLNLNVPGFDSVALNYVLHCLPGTIRDKSAVLANLKGTMNTQATLFGSTILGKGVELNAVAQKLSAAYNAKGVFCNQEDDRQGLESILQENFSSSHVEQIGCVALFWAKK